MHLHKVALACHRELPGSFEAIPTEEINFEQLRPRPNALEINVDRAPLQGLTKRDRVRNALWPDNPKPRIR